MAAPRKAPIAAAIVAFILFALGMITAVIDRPLAAIFSLVPLAAAIGILRRRVWSAYGFAVCLIAQLILIPILMLDGGGLSPMDVVPSIIVTLPLAWLFFMAGKRLELDGARRGWPVPWIALAILSTAPLIFVRAFVIPNSSMEPTLLLGDQILVRRFPLPKVGRDDLVVLRSPRNPAEEYVKRIVGIPGDRIKFVNKVLYRNGAPLTEPYAAHESNFTDPYRDNFPSGQPPAFLMLGNLLTHVVNSELVVPDGEYFVLGDNRDDSVDSRSFGLVPFANVIGKPVLIYDSTDRPEGSRTTRWNRILKHL